MTAGVTRKIVPFRTNETVPLSGGSSYLAEESEEMGAGIISARSGPENRAGPFP